MFKSVVAALTLVFAAQVHAAEVFKIDTAASTVAWKGFKKLGSTHNGGIAVKEGQVEVDKGQVVGGSVAMDMAKITNEDLKDSAEYHAKLLGHLSSDDFFNIAKYPTSTFKITSVTPAKEKGKVLVKGDFTMIGKTNPIEFPATVKVEKGTVTGDAVVKIDRTKWGLKYGSGNIFKELAADKIISDEFELTLKLVAKK